MRMWLARPMMVLTPASTLLLTATVSRPMCLASSAWRFTRKAQDGEAGKRQPGDVDQGLILVWRGAVGGRGTTLAYFGRRVTVRIGMAAMLAAPCPYRFILLSWQYWQYSSMLLAFCDFFFMQLVHSIKPVQKQANIIDLLRSVEWKAHSYQREEGIILLILCPLLELPFCVNEFVLTVMCQGNLIVTFRWPWQTKI